MAISIQPGVNLRTTSVLPFLNGRTVAVLLVMGCFLLNINVRLLRRETVMDYLYLLMLVQLTPVLISLSRRHFTYMSLVMLNHFSSLSLSKYNLLRDNPDVTRIYPELMLAIKEQIFCSVLMILVYHALRMLVFQGVAEKETYQDMILTRKQVLILAAYISAVPLFIHYLPPWFLIIHFLLLSADMLLLFTSRCPGSEWLLWVLKGGSIVLSIRYFLETGMLTMMGALIMLFFFTGIMMNRASLFAAMFFVLLTCSIQSVKGSFRTSLKDAASQSMSDRIEVLKTLLLERFVNNESSDGNITWESRWETLLSGFARAGDDSMERVLALTPKKVPYWGGETYASIPFLFIPRFLWPEKPDRHFWNKYGRLYGVLSTDDFQTSVGVSYLAEGYMNFGYPGMYGVAILVAFLIAFMERFSYLAFKGYYYFPFLLYVQPMLAPATDLGSMLNSLFVMISITVLARPTMLRMAQRDEYN